jgi:general secretion pathway protein D
VVSHASDSGARAFQEGQEAERSGDHLRAYLLYAQAALADGTNHQYAKRMAAMAQSGALQPRTSAEADTGPDPANETLAANLLADGLITDESLLSPAASPPLRLALSATKQSFTIKGPARDLFEKVGAACGIRLLFEPDYREPAPFTFAITDVECQEALRALEAATDSFMVPVGETTALVARDTAQNRILLTPVVAIAVPIPERIALQEAQELATAVQQTLEIRRISLDATRRVVYFRDSAAKVFAAREMFAALSRLRAQVVVDVEFLSVSKTSSLGYGLTLPTSASITYLGSLPGTPTVHWSGFPPLSLFGVGIGNTAVLATLGRTSAMSLLETQVVALDGQAVTFKMGDRYPVVTSIFSGASGPAQASGTIPPISYIDLGLGLKLTAAVHERNEVSLDIDADFKSLGAGSVNGIPVIADQQYQGKVRLEAGEWAIVAGLLQVTHTNNPTGIAGLSSIPVLGNLFRSQTREDDRNEILLVLKPRIVALPPWESAPLKPIWMGTESRPITVF